VALTATAAGLLFATSATTADGTDLRAGRRLELTELISRERSATANQERRAAALRREVEAATEQAATRDAGVAQEQARGDALALAAGTVPVSGPALTVSLDDAPPGTDAPSPDDLVVHQQDVQAVVNALWAGGAEAMTLMGQRVISTSAVRCVGNTVILHGQVYGPPFVVTAIGDREAMRTALSVEPGVELFLRYVERFGLGYAVDSVDEVVLPAYRGPLDLRSVAAQP
jgi:uncharacterized protein YlxW (UPF0749 family)